LSIILNDSLDDLIKIKDSFINKGGKELSFENALNEIKKCDLSPGLNFQESQYVYPDLRITKKNNQTKVKFIEKDFPKIKIDETLAENVKKNLKIEKNDKLSEKISEAKWLLSSINKRNETVLKVGELILSKQLNFFENNPLKIATLSNKEISEKLNIHQSTVSRILRNKYIDTPMGVIPLKSLMVSSVSKSRNVTSIQLMKLIEDITKKEKRPKSDKQIAIELNKRGFNLARRTITKYRKMNNIPSSRDR
jgi:RNA polymerase sigma-54 factor